LFAEEGAKVAVIDISADGGWLSGRARDGERIGDVG
jgi:hypothetical protein